MPFLRFPRTVKCCPSLGVPGMPLDSATITQALSIIPMDPQSADRLAPPPHRIRVLRELSVGIFTSRMPEAVWW